MDKYFAMRIMAGKLDYWAVVEKYPARKDKIDAILIAEGYTIPEKVEVKSNGE